MKESLEQRLQTEYHFSPWMAQKAMKLHEKAEGKPYFGKMAVIVLSPFASCYPKTQQAVYEILAMGPKEDAYKISIYKALDPKGYALVLGAYIAGVAMQQTGLSDFTNHSAASLTKDGASLAAYAMLAENAIVATASLVTHKPMPRLLAHRDNPMIWLDTVRVTKNAIQSLTKMMSDGYAGIKKQAAYFFPEF